MSSLLHITRYATRNHQFITTVGAGATYGFSNEYVQVMVVVARAFAKHVTACDRRESSAVRVGSGALGPLPPAEVCADRMLKLLPPLLSHHSPTPGAVKRTAKRSVNVRECEEAPARRAA